MVLARAWAVTLIGLDGHVVEVEADLAQGLPGLTLIGLPDASLHEARDRVRAAIVNSAEQWPQRKITVGLSPASLPKRGSGFDLAMAAAVLSAHGRLPARALDEVVLLGELGLDGSVKPVRGALPAVLTAARAGFARVIVPGANLREARLLPDIQVEAVASLRDLLALLRGEPWAEGVPDETAQQSGLTERLDMLEVAGQVVGRTAMEVCAAGGHHAFLLGPPGSGKTMLARRLPSLLPPLDLEQALEVTAVHSVAGLLPAAHPLLERPPFQDPHHGCSAAAIIGGGSGIARPGAASLAHHGTLFLDEAPEFSRSVLDALRQPIERGSLTITRVGGTATYPCAFTLVLAANPCPCAKGDRCTCTPQARRGYLGKLSGPVLDRIDLHVTVDAVTKADVMAENGVGESSAAIAVRVLHARQRAAERYRGTPWTRNGQVPLSELRRGWPLPATVLAPLGAALDEGRLTARGFGRVLRVAWTLADLTDVGQPDQALIEMALGWRQGNDRWLAA